MKENYLKIKKVDFARYWWHTPLKKKKKIDIVLKE